MGVNLQKFLEAQRKKIDEDKWAEGIRRGCDPGQDFVLEWIKKYAKKFRKEYALSDLKEGLKELSILRKEIKMLLEQLTDRLGILDKCEEKLLEGIELIETEEENGNGKK